MPIGRWIQTLVLACSLIALPTLAFAQDAGVSPPTAPDGGVPPDAGTGSSSSATPADIDSDSAIKAAFKAITTKDWFALAGAILALVALGVRELLKRKWPTWQKDRWGVLLVAGLAGVGAITHAWLADERVLDSTTWLGALKVFGAAVVAYVVPKKLLTPEPPVTT